MDKKAAMSEKTREKLKQAFWSLYAEGGMSNVTVAALTKKAGYNRCTFYNYYDDVQAILDEIEDQLLASVESRFVDIFSKGVPKSLDELFSLTFDVFETYGDKLYVLLGKNGNTMFRMRLQKSISAHYLEVFKNQLSVEHIEYVAVFVVSAGLGLLGHWYETGKKHSSEEFLRLAQSLLATGVFGQLAKGSMA